MITLRPAAERGQADHGWLKAAHTFSFAEYRDPAHTHFGVLRVINQDRVAPGQGFGTHGHADMEIVTYVLDGVLEHKDSYSAPGASGATIRPGEVQLMSAGDGVLHSEFNASDTDELHLLQMWVFPTHKGGAPRYEQRAYPEAERRGKLRLVVSPDGADGSLTIQQDARLYVGLLHGDERVEHTIPEGRMGWLHLAKGSLTLDAKGSLTLDAKGSLTLDAKGSLTLDAKGSLTPDGERLGAGDGAAIEHERAFTLSEGEGAEFVYWELPAR